MGRACIRRRQQTPPCEMYVCTMVKCCESYWCQNWMASICRMGEKNYSLYSKAKSWWVYLSVIIQHLKNERIYVITRPNLSFGKSWSMEKLKLPRWKITCNSILFSIFWNMKSQWLTLKTCKDYLSLLSWQNIGVIPMGEKWQNACTMWSWLTTWHVIKTFCFILLSCNEVTTLDN